MTQPVRLVELVDIILYIFDDPTSKATRTSWYYIYLMTQPIRHLELVDIIYIYIDDTSSKAHST